MTLGIGAAAVNTGNNLLYLVLGSMLALLLTSGVLSEIVLRGVRVTRGRPPRAFAGSPSLFGFTVENRKRRFVSTSFEVGDVLEGERDANAAHVLSLPAGERTDVVVERTLARRGVTRSSHVFVRTRFPFGLLEKSRIYRDTFEYLVFPALVPVGREARRHERVVDEGASTTRGGGTEILGVRDYREGEPSRDIHWRRSASLGRTLARERAQQAESTRLVRLDLVRAADEAESEFEDDVSRAASLAVAIVGRGGAVVVTTERGLLGRADAPNELDPLLARLALVSRETAR